MQGELSRPEGARGSEVRRVQGLLARDSFAAVRDLLNERYFSEEYNEGDEEGAEQDGGVLWAAQQQQHVPRASIVAHAKALGELSGALFRGKHADFTAGVGRTLRAYDCKRFPGTGNSSSSSSGHEWQQHSRGHRGGCGCRAGGGVLQRRRHLLAHRAQRRCEPGRGWRDSNGRRRSGGRGGRGYEDKDICRM
jgi:hypothetical protein